MQENREEAYRVHGYEDGRRIESRELEERIQNAVHQGHRRLLVEAFGHHGIGGRLWRSGDDPVEVIVHGPPGQRVGSMGFPNTTIRVSGNASDDVGWLNAGAEIVIHGYATNGVANAMAQGRISVAGSIGARGMNMTKRNPRFAPPELWVLGSVGDYFAEFMAGGTAVICGFEPQNPENVLGYRPCVGMVGGRIFFRGQHRGFSQVDAKQVPITDEDWQWLEGNLRAFLQRIDREELYEELARPEEWQLLEARNPLEKKTKPRRSVSEFRSQVWDGELGTGGLIGDLSDMDRSQIPLVVTGELRRYVPVWENRKYAAPCEASCPTGIPVQQRWELVREGRVDEAVDLAMHYTPFPATVCGYLCPNLCMQSCTRLQGNMPAADVTKLGQASVQASMPELPPASGSKIAVIGGGPAGISIAWQLRLKGHEPVVFDRGERLGGKISEVIPRSRIPEEVLHSELERVEEAIPHVHQGKDLTGEEVEQLKLDYDFVVLAVGAHRPRSLEVPGKERMQPALDFLRAAQSNQIEVGDRVVVIGAGNVGCDVATEAHRMGARDITLIDIQEPASFGKERREAERAGATFKWPVFVQEVNVEGVLLTSGELLPADTVVVAVGEEPDTGFLPQSVKTERGFVSVNENYQTTDPNIFAIGDAVKPGLITDAIGAGRRVAQVIDDILQGKRPRGDRRAMIDRSRIRLEYFDPRYTNLDELEQCAGECASCGSCRDCGICIHICPTMAISKEEREGGDFEMVVNPERCIGCGFCAAACPCGIWDMVENEELV
jgi:NADPH-dependent glutamate synthase beta subunit-like oxidoreductase/glutamate synthase domain-containing protein 3/Pyruvate/2-oxoacid:ferredoxin oxidoreductase delta subunit